MNLPGELCCRTVQSSTEVSTLADDYSSTLTVSDKVVLGGESMAASQKVSSDDDHEQRDLARAEDGAANGRSPNPVKRHLLSDVDSEGMYIRWLVCCRFTSVVALVGCRIREFVSCTCCFYFAHAGVESWHKRSYATFLGSPAMDEERLKPLSRVEISVIWVPDSQKRHLEQLS